MRLDRPMRLTRLALLIAISVAGSFLKIPGVLGTPALDSCPAYLGAMVFGPRDGALVGALGHLATAANAGFPLTPLLHAVVAAMMAVAAAAYGWLGRRAGLVPATVSAVVLNGVLAPLALSLLPGFGLAAAMAALPQLVVASALNAGVASCVYLALRGRLWS